MTYLPLKLCTNCFVFKKKNYILSSTDVVSVLYVFKSIGRECFLFKALVRERARHETWTCCPAANNDFAGLAECLARGRWPWLHSPERLRVLDHLHMRRLGRLRSYGRGRRQQPPGEWQWMQPVRLRGRRGGGGGQCRHRPLALLHRRHAGGARWRRLVVVVESDGGARHAARG